MAVADNVLAPSAPTAGPTVPDLSTFNNNTFQAANDPSTAFQSTGGLSDSVQQAQQQAQQAFTPPRTAAAVQPDPTEQQTVQQPPGPSTQSPLMNPGAYQTPMGPTRMSFDQADPLISGTEDASGDPAKLNWHFDSHHTAGGLYQITDENWRAYAPRVGIDTKQFPTAVSTATLGPDQAKALQRKVAKLMYDEHGFAPWAPFNPRLRKMINWQGEVRDPVTGQLVQSGTPGAIGANPDPYAAASNALETSGAQLQAGYGQLAQTIAVNEAKQTEIIQKAVEDLKQKYASEQENAEKVAKLKEAQAAQLQSDDEKLTAYARQTPTRQAAYATVMHLTPMLSILAAIGGKATHTSAIAMLGATNGIIQGVNAGAENQFKDAVDKWTAQFNAMKDHMKNMQDVYKTYEEAYQGRADAAEKAAEHTRTVMNDELMPSQNAIANGKTLFDSQATLLNQMDTHALAFLKIVEAQDAAKMRAQLENQMTGDSAYVAAMRVIQGEKLNDVVPYSRGSGARVAVLNMLPELWKQMHGNDPQYQTTGGDQRMLADLSRFLSDQRVQFQAQTRAATTAGNIAGRVELASQEIMGWIPLARSASEAVPRTNWVPFNELLNTGRENLSDPAQIRLYDYTNSILNAYNVLSARGGTDINVRQRNLMMLSTATSQQAYETALDAITKEMRVASQAARRSMTRAAYLDRTALPGEDDIQSDPNTGLLNRPNAAPWEALPSGPDPPPAGGGGGWLGNMAGDVAKGVGSMFGMGGGGSSGGRTVLKTGTLNGRKVVQYSDGTTAYVN